MTYFSHKYKHHVVEGDTACVLMHGGLSPRNRQRRTVGTTWKYANKIGNYIRCYTETALKRLML